MTYAQTYDHGSLSMNCMNAKACMDNRRDDHAPSFAFASSIGYSFRIKSITEIGSIDGTQYKGIKFEQVSPNGNER